MDERPAVVDGLVVVDKPGGLTSHDVVARVRGLARTRKVGHAGTLDPMATGVLVVGVGRATRLMGHLMLGEKTYDATVRLGESTSTDDAEGAGLGVTDCAEVSEDDVAGRLEAFRGEISQVPSAVSAIKVDGKRSYQRVRDGEQVELESRPVTVHALDVRAVRREGPHLDVDLTVRVSSGFYVRALARDLGFVLGVGGHLTALRRTTVGPFDLAGARTLEQLGEEFSVLPIAEAARVGFASRDLDDEEAAAVRVGRRLTADLGTDDPTALFAPDGEFLALYARGGSGDQAVAHAVAVFVG